MEKEEGEERGGGRQALAKTCSRFLKPRQKNMFDKKIKKTCSWFLQKPIEKEHHYPYSWIFNFFFQFGQRLFEKSFQYINICEKFLERVF